jgi:hypothetical protein
VPTLIFAGEHELTKITEKGVNSAFLRIEITEKNRGKPDPSSSAVYSDRQQKTKKPEK